MQHLTSSPWLCPRSVMSLPLKPCSRFLHMSKKTLAHAIMIHNSIGACQNVYMCFQCKNKRKSKQLFVIKPYSHIYIWKYMSYLKLFWLNWSIVARETNNGNHHMPLPPSAVMMSGILHSACSKQNHNDL